MASISIHMLSYTGYLQLQISKQFLIYKSIYYNTYKSIFDTDIS